MEETNNEVNKEPTNQNNTDTSEVVEGTIIETPVQKSAFSTESVRSGGTESSSGSAYYSNQESTFTPSAAYTSTVTDESQTASNGFGIASLVMGILSILTSCCCGVGLLFTLLGIIFGCLQKKNEDGKKPGFAIAGIILSSVGLILAILILFLSTLYGSSLSSYYY